LVDLRRKFGEIQGWEIQKENQAFNGGEKGSSYLEFQWDFWLRQYLRKLWIEGEDHKFQ